MLKALRRAATRWFQPAPQTKKSSAFAPVSAMPIAAEKLAALRADDRFLISYPRSGNTWVRYLLLDLIQASRTVESYTGSIGQLIPDIHIQELDNPVQREFQMPFRLFKSHNIRDLRERRFVYVFREAADCLVSYFHFETREKKASVSGTTIDEYCLRMIPSWCEHMNIARESKAAHPDRVHFVSYEMLLENTGAELFRIAAFYGLEGSEKTCAEAATRNEFKTWAKTEKGSPSASTNPNASAQPFFRKGRTGASREELKPEAFEAISAATKEIYESATQSAHTNG